MDSAQLLMEMFCRHLGALGIQYVFLDSNGNPSSEEKSASYSGFFISLDDDWYFVTAGHVFHNEGKGLHELVENGQIRITQSSICDYFRQTATHRICVPVDFDSLPIFTVNDSTNELDFALIGLRAFYVDALRANNVRPITETNIDADHEYPELVHKILGFPNETKIDGDDSGHTLEWLQPALVGIEKLQEDSEVARTKPNMIAAQLLADELNSPVGLSGGPVFALTRLDSGLTGYWAIGIQSCWYPRTRTVFACPIQRAIEIFKQHVNANDAT